MSAETNDNQSSGTRHPALLLIGWDGATPELLERYLAAGKLPAVQKLIDRGSYRPLRSTIPPVTATAWPSFLSGKNAGKHGLFDFVTPGKDGEYQFDYTNGGHRRDRNDDICALLNRAGLAVGCVNVPMTYPPKAIDGFMISGLDAPDERSGIAHPAELFERVQQKVGSYRIDNRHLGNMKTDDDRRGAIAEFKRVESLRTDITLAMIDEQPVDALIIIYNATDQVQHHFWHLQDPTHPQCPGVESAEYQAFEDAIEQIYIHCDLELARLMEAFPEADVMIMSDHGAGPTCGPQVRLNNALAQAGLLTWANTQGGLKSKLASTADSFLRRTLSAKQKAALVRLIPGGRSAIESMSLPAVDWSKTTAFVYEGFTLSPCVWLNRKSLFAQGTVEDGSAYDDACEQVISALTGLKDPKTGEQVIPKAYRSRDIYKGDLVAMAPDLILDWWEGNTFTMGKSHPKHDSESPVYWPEGPAVPGRDITGIHRRNGVLIAGGPHISLAQGEKEQADLIDVVPTALAMLGLTPPDDVDGKVLSDIISGRIEAGQTQDIAPSDEGDDQENREYTDEEKQAIEARLSGLGYL